ncbi:MAG: tyrosine-type recombinase/integrase [Phycisphaerae bacterium]|nr:tyrosine-type recombinase/integrase [Phycisphaerae bacterium]
MRNRRTRHLTAVWLIKRRCKGGTTYRLRWRDRAGRQHSHACGRDYVLARTMRDQKREELRAGLLGEYPDMSVDDFRERLKTLMAKSPRTIETTRETLRLVNKLCRPAVIADIDRGMVMDFRAKRLAAGLSPATVNKDLRQLKSALSYAVDAGLLKANPLLRWKGMMLREPEKRIRVVEPAEFEKLLNACKLPELRVLLTVAYRQGLRRTELTNLRWLGPHDEPLVDLENHVLHVINRWEEGELTKSRKNRSIPLHPEAREALAKLWEATPKIVEGGAVKPKFPHVFVWPEDGRQYHPDWVSHYFASLVEEAGLPACSIHDLRRSFSTLAQRAGVDKYTVKDLGGWSAVSVVERHYTGEVSSVLKEAMNRIVAAG